MINNQRNKQILKIFLPRTVITKPFLFSFHIVIIVFGFSTSVQFQQLNKNESTHPLHGK